MSDAFLNDIHPKDDPRTVEDLINAALTESEEAAWDAVCALQWRGTHEVLETACILCRSQCPQERCLGADILGQLGVEKRTLPQAAIKTLISLLDTETDIEVLEAALVAVSHHDAPQAIPTVSRYAYHPEARIRHAAVLALTGYEDRTAIERIIALTQDANAHVRDWATFGLGTQLETDTPEIRNSLADRLDDPDADTRGEAFIGLARRGDRRVVPALMRELTSRLVGSLAVEAAEMIRAPELHPGLVALRDWWDVDPALLDDAIITCQPV